MNHFRKQSMLLAAVASVMVGASTSSAANRTWVGPNNGVWNVASNCSPNQVPQSGDSVYVINSGPSFVIANYDNGVSPALSWLQVDSAAAQGWMTFKQSGGTLNTNGEAIGGSHNGSFTQEGGRHNAAPTPTTPYYIGWSDGSTGSYNFLNGVLNTGAMYLGYQGNGFFNQDNGSHNTTQLMLGAQLHGVGAYTLNNGTLTADTITIGAASGGAGRFYPNGGTLNAQRMIMGSPGAGSFNMNGGTLNVARDLVLGNSNFNTTAATVTWNITKGSANVGSMTIGNTSPGWVDQFAGSTLTVQHELNIGKNAPGFYRMGATAPGAGHSERLYVDGQLNVGGANGEGTFVMDGGFIWGNSSLQIASTINARGSFTENGSSSQCYFNGIGIAAATNAVGTLQLNSGMMSAGNYVTGIGFGGVLRINGGDFNANTAGIINNGCINVQSGHCYLGDLSMTTHTGQVWIGLGEAEGRRIDQYGVAIGDTPGATGGHVKIYATEPNAADVQRRNVIGSLYIWANEANAYKGYLDLANNDLILTQTDYSIATAFLQQGYNDGEWNGNGIRSSEAGSRAPARTLGILRGCEYVNNTGANTFDGLSIGAEDVLIKYTYFGDVDFNGQVEVSDYNLIDFGFANHLGGWGNGDVDFNGSVDAGDYNLIDFAFATQNNTLNRAIAYLDGTDRNASTMMSDPSLQQVVAHYAQFGETYANGFLAQVPEPSTAMITIASVATAMTTRRRRRTVAST